jgi:hypothetical protein
MALAPTMYQLVVDTTSTFMRLLVGLCIVVIGLGSSLRVSACECAPLLTLAQEYQQAAAVYVATAVTARSGWKGGTTEVVQLKIERVFKGNGNVLKYVLIASDKCQFHFQMGKTYLIYANNEHPQRSFPLTNAHARRTCWRLERKNWLSYKS